MTTRESLPNAAALEQIEAPSREVAEAKRRAAESEASDKPALKDAVETLARLDDPRVVGLPRVPTILGVGDQQTERTAKRAARDTNKLPSVPRGEVHTSPSLARVLAGDDRRDADTLVDEPGDALPEEPVEQPAATQSKMGVLIVAGAALVLLLLFAMLAIGLWGGEATVPSEPSSAKTATIPGTTTATANETVPVTAIAPATVVPPPPSAVGSAEPGRATASVRASSKTSAKTASAAESTSKPTSPATSSAKPQKTTWVPEDS